MSRVGGKTKSRIWSASACGVNAAFMLPHGLLSHLLCSTNDDPPPRRVHSSQTFQNKNTPTKRQQVDLLTNVLRLFVAKVQSTKKIHFRNKQKLTYFLKFRMWRENLFKNLLLSHSTKLLTNLDRKLVYNTFFLS